MEKPTILLIIPNLNFGGAQRVFYNLSIELSKKYRVVECVFNFNEGHAFKTGNQVISLEVQGGSNFLSKSFQFYLRCRKLAKIKQQLNPIVSISHLEGADYINLLTRQSVKTICCIHGTKFHDENIHGLVGKIRRHFLIPYLYRRADKIITVSQGIRDELINTFRLSEKRITWIPNFFYPDRIQEMANESIPAKFEFLFKDDRPVFISIGRLSIQKNYAGFVRLAASYKKITKTKWVILGDGELLEPLVAMSEQLGLRVYSYLNPTTALPCDIYFLGYHENPFSFIAKSDWFILSSGWEGFPMVLGEAMACGTPIIATDCPTGPKEFLSMDHDYSKLTLAATRNEYGILIPLLNKEDEKTYDDLAKDLHTILGEKSIREAYSKKGKERVVHFDAMHVMKRWFEEVKNLQL